MSDRETDELGPRRPIPDTAGELLAAGTLAGMWRITSQIASGGCGVVYAARHDVLDRVAAVKVLFAALAVSPNMVDRFIREARAVNHIKHPNIVDIFDFGVLPDGRPFYAMELLQRDDLQQRMDASGRLTVAEALAIMKPICHALEAAHRAGYVHRDLKARNIGFALAPDGTEVVKLLDFGVAKLLEQDRTGMTGTLPVGTLHCMSPEQIRGEAVDARTDVYALGVLLYHLLVGRYPYDSIDVAELERLHLEAHPPAPSRFVPISPLFDAVIQRALSKTPADRPASAAELLDLVIAAAAGAESRRVDAIGIRIVLEGPDELDDEFLESAAAAAEYATNVLGGHGFSPVLVTGNAVLVAGLVGDDPEAARARAQMAVTEIAHTLAAQPENRLITPRVSIHTGIAEVADRTGAFVGGPLLDLETWPR